jgi:hypothetical protein
VLHQLAYGTDKVVHGAESEVPTVQEIAKAPATNASGTANESTELTQLRARVAELESKLAGTAVAATTKA